MTTIAIDTKGSIAADGMRTWGDQIRGRAFQKIRARERAIYAFTGTVPLLTEMVAWHEAGAKPKDLPAEHNPANSSGWTLVVIDAQGVTTYTSGCPYPERFDPPIAFGAGQDYALGAMLAGASAARAIEIVSGLCNHTGGEIQVVNIAEALGLNAIKEAAE